MTRTVFFSPVRRSPRSTSGRRALLAVSILAAGGSGSGWLPRSLRADTFLEPAAGFAARDARTLSGAQFIGGLAALPGGGLAVFDGTAVTILEAGSPEPRVRFTPPVSPTFGSFLRLSPDSRSLYFGETHPGATPHLIYRVPLAEEDGEAAPIDAIRFNFDLAFDDAGRAFVSSLEVGSENRIYLVDGDPSAASDAVVTGIPGYSGPVAFHGGRLYCATALPDGNNRIFYLESPQIESGIGPDREFNFADLPEEQQLPPTAPGFFNLVFAGGILYASDPLSGTIGRIDLAASTPTLEPFASLAIPGGASGSVSYLAFVPGGRPFEAGAGSAGGHLFAAATDFTTFNSIVAITPQLYFQRGRINLDDTVDISDASALLEFLFRGGTAPDPVEASDVNDDGSRDLSDAIYLLNFLFIGGKEPPAPYRQLGPDPTP